MGNVKVEGESRVHETKGKGGKGQPAGYGVADMKDNTWNISKTTSPGRVRKI